MKILKNNEIIREKEIKNQYIEDILKEKYNKRCFDCKKLNPDIISLYNGIFICKECARIIHSKLNNKINLLVDNNLQNLSSKGIKYLYYGGNKKLSDFVNYEYPLLKSIKKNKFYMTKAMYYYRQWLKYLVYGGKKPLKPSFEDCYNVYFKEDKNKKSDQEHKKEKDIKCINQNFDNERENNYGNFQKVTKKEQKKYIPDNNYQKNKKIKSLLLDNENNYFFLEEKNPINNLNLTTLKNNEDSNYYKNSILSKKLNNTNINITEVYSKPNLLTPKISQKTNNSFYKTKKIKNREYKIHNSIIFPNRNNNYFLLNNNTYNNSLMNNFLVGAAISRNNLYNHNQTTYNRNLHNTFFSSFQSTDNNPSYYFEKTLNKSGFVFKKKKLRNSFSLSKKNNKSNKDNYKNSDISIIEANSFQIIPNYQEKIARKKRNLINLKVENKVSDTEKEFPFYTKKDILKKEKEKKKEIKSFKDLQKINKKLNINKLLNLIIEIKNKHKKDMKSDLNDKIIKNRETISKNLQKIKIKKNEKKVEENKKDREINDKEKNVNESEIDKDDNISIKQKDFMSSRQENFYNKRKNKKY